jgi:exosome complex exonuclease DIS3/RRP44
VELHTHIFFRKRSVQSTARVIRVRANGIIVFVPKFGIEAPVLFKEGDPEGAGGDAAAAAEAAVAGAAGAGTGKGGGAVLDEEAMTVTTVGRCTLTLSKPVLKPPIVSALETIIS